MEYSPHDRISDGRYIISTHEPPAEIVDGLGLRDLHTAWQAALAEVKAATDARVRASGVFHKAEADPSTPTAQVDKYRKAYIDAQAAERRARSAAQRAAVAFDKAYVEHPDRRTLWARRALRFHEDAVSAFSSWSAAIDERDRAYHQAGQPGRENYWRSEPYLGTRVSLARQDLGNVTRTFPTSALEMLAAGEEPPSPPSSTSSTGAGLVIRR